MHYDKTLDIQNQKSLMPKQRNYNQRSKYMKKIDGWQIEEKRRR